MTLRTKLLGAGAALLLSTGAALAVPATAQTDLNVRSGPGTQYPVVGSIQGGETVDAGACTGGWCRVSFSGGTGWASRSYLAMGGAVAPGPAVAVAPYVYDDDYYDGYYDYGYSYGPSFGFYAGPRFGHRWRGHPCWARPRPVCRHRLRRRTRPRPHKPGQAAARTTISEKNPPFPS